MKQKLCAVNSHRKDSGFLDSYQGKSLTSEFRKLLIINDVCFWSLTNEGKNAFMSSKKYRLFSRKY